MPANLRELHPKGPAPPALGWGKGGGPCDLGAVGAVRATQVRGTASTPAQESWVFLPKGGLSTDDVAGPVLGAEGTLLTEFLFCVQSGSLPSARRCLPPATCPSTLGAHGKWPSSPLHPTTNHWASTVARGLALEPALNNPVRCPSTVCARWPRLTLQPDEVASSPHSFSLNCKNYTPTPSASVITASRPAILPSPSQPLCHSTVIILHPMKPQVSLSAFHGGGN